MNELDIAMARIHKNLDKILNEISEINSSLQETKDYLIDEMKKGDEK